MKSKSLNNSRIAVTGVGLSTALGAGVTENWDELLKGTSAVKIIEQFDTTHLKTRFGALVTRFDDEDSVSSVERTYQLGKEVLEEALTMAKPSESLHRVPLFFATPSSETEWKSRITLHNRIMPGQKSELSVYADAHDEFVQNIIMNDYTASNGCRLADDFEIWGGVTTLTTACASGASAIQLAVDAIRRGDTDLAIVVGADASITPENLIRFSLLSALSTKNEAPEFASRPFDRHRDGFVMGEGAAALVLESEQYARNRGANIFGYVLGCGNATDNFHKTRSHPSGDYIVASMQRAMDDAGVSAGDIGYINAHGTSTPENDKMESLGIARQLGHHCDKTLVSSTKSMIGHTLCAAGIIEAVISLQAVNTAVVPPNINLTELDPEVSLHIATQPTPLHGPKIAMSNSFGFGGQNVTLLLAAKDYDRHE